MNLITLSRRSLTFHARSHLGAILGAAVSAAVLIGALVVGDSVRESLKEMALARLGKTEQAIASGDRFFTPSFATNFSEAAAVLQLSGIAVNGDGDARANQVQVLGVDSNFWKLAPTPQNLQIPPDGVFINEALARQLKVSTNDSILVRVQKPSELSLDAPLAKGEDQTVGLRVNIDRVLSDDEFGRFGLAASQLPPFNAFFDREILGSRVKAKNKANLLLWTGQKKLGDGSLRAHLAPADVEVQFRKTNAFTELRSPRVFLDPAIEEAALKVGKPAPLLTYFVNQLKVGTNTTPYSMVTAMGADLADDEIIINQWLADDLRAKAGDPLELTYFVVGAMRKLTEAHATFKIKKIVPIEGIYADRTLMPDFPGMADAANCRDWDTGFPINNAAIRDKDEKYWDDYRGTPKAFVNLALGQKLWSNRFGKLTAIRWPAAETNVEARFMQALEPSKVGLRFEPVRQQALAASTQGQDFGELFLSFSFFLIVAALMLMTLLFGFSIEQRAVEMGTLLAIGLSPKQVRRLLLFEGAGLAVVGTILGLIGGVLYAEAMLAGLSTIWKSAVGTSALHAHILPQTLAMGAASSIVVAIATLAWSLRKEGKRPARELLAASAGSEEARTGQSRRAATASWLTTIVGLVGAVALTIFGFTQGNQANAETFFSAGGLLLIGGIAAATLWMRKQNNAATATLPSLSVLGLRNIARRRKRSRAVLILLSSGAFLIASIGVFRLDSDANATAKDSGTGGFMFIGESSLPVVHDLNSQAGRDFYNLRATNFQVIAFRVRAGDEASCLNLNKAQKPRLLGVQANSLNGHFRFTQGDWKDLESKSADIVPAIGDANSIQWAMHAKVGDLIPYEDERGRTFKIKLVGAIANSILQGNLIISEKNFIERFPTEAGYRMFLIDAPSKNADEVGRELTRALQDFGLELTRATDRLNAFNAVQNTYINTFQILGGLGLLLGSFGLGVVVLRNVFERRGELALLQAVGFTPQRVRRLVLGEHAALMAAGLLIGVVAAVVAVLPHVSEAHSILSLLLTLAGVVVFGLAATWFAASLALRGNLLESLRSE
jgi:putative ABC transport system permease protein